MSYESASGPGSDRFTDGYDGLPPLGLPGGEQPPQILQPLPPRYGDLAADAIRYTAMGPGPIGPLQPGRQPDPRRDAIEQAITAGTADYYDLVAARRAGHLTKDEFDEAARRVMAARDQNAGAQRPTYVQPGEVAATWQRTIVPRIKEAGRVMPQTQAAKPFAKQVAAARNLPRGARVEAGRSALPMRILKTVFRRPYPEVRWRRPHAVQGLDLLQQYNPATGQQNTLVRLDRAHRHNGVGGSRFVRLNDIADGHYANDAIGVRRTNGKLARDILTLPLRPFAALGRRIFRRNRAHP